VLVDAAGGAGYSPGLVFHISAPGPSSELTNAWKWRLAKWVKVRIICFSIDIEPRDLAVIVAWGWYGVGAVFVWALLDEVTKIPIRGRHFSWLDVGLNLGGAALGMVLWLLV
jgi:hypothetical protein